MYIKRRLLVSALTAVLLCLSTPVAGGAADAPDTDPVLPPVPDIGRQIHQVLAPLPAVSIVGSTGPFIGINLDTAIAMAISQNQDLALLKSSYRVSGYQVVADKGPFDVNFVVQPVLNRSVDPALSPFSAGPDGGPVTQSSAGLTTGFTMTSMNGGQYSLTANATRTDSNSTSNSYDPYYQTAISFNMTQPLGSGRFSKDHRDLELAVVNTHTSLANTLISASSTVTNVIDAYWDLVAAWRNLGIQEEALSQARAQSSSNERLVRRGSAAPVDVVESDTQVDVDQDSVYSALQNVSSLENRLKGLILMNPADGLWSANLVPTSPVAEIPAEPSLQQVIVSGLVHRPEFEIVAAQLRTAQIQRAFARDEARPKIDLQLGASANGFAGENGLLSQNPLFTGFAPLYTSINDLIANANANLPANSTPIPTVASLAFTNPANTTGRWGKSWQSLFNNDYPVYNAQLNIAFPIRNDRARGDLAIAREDERQATIQEAEYISRLIMDARNAVQMYDSARQRLISAHAARSAADRVLLGEQRRFTVGRSTTFLVLQRQIEAANDEGRELQAQTDLNKSIAELDRVSGAVYDKHGIHLKLPSQKTVAERIREAGLPDSAALEIPIASPMTSTTASPKPVATASPVVQATATPSATMAPMQMTTPMPAMPMSKTNK